MPDEADPRRAERAQPALCRANPSCCFTAPRHTIIGANYLSCRWIGRAFPTSPTGGRAERPRRSSAPDEPRMAAETYPRGSLNEPRTRPRQTKPTENQDGLKAFPEKNLGRHGGVGMPGRSRGDG